MRSDLDLVITFKNAIEKENAELEIENMLIWIEDELYSIKRTLESKQLFFVSFERCGRYIIRLSKEFVYERTNWKFHADLFYCQDYFKNLI